MDPIDAGVRRARRRLRSRLFLHAATRGVFIGAILILIYTILDRLVFVGFHPLAAAGVLIGAPLVGSLLLAVLRLPGRHSAAVSLDERFDLKERVATAVSLEGDATPIADAVRADARERLRRLDLKRGMPVRLPTSFVWLVPLLLVLALLASTDLLPYVDVFNRAEAMDRLAKEQEQVKVRGKKLLEKREELRKKAERKRLPEVEKTLREWERLAQDLQENPNSRRDALVKMSKLADRIREKRNSSEFQTAAGMAKALSLRAKPSKLTREIQSALAKGDLKAAAAAMDALQKKLESGEISSEMMKALKEELQSLSLDLQAAPELAGALEEAAQDLADDDLQAALQDLEEAEIDLEELAKAFEEMAMLEEMLEDLEDQKRDLILDEEDLAALEAEICSDCGGTMEEAWKDLQPQGPQPGDPQGDQQGEAGECPSCEGKGGDCPDCNGTGKTPGKGSAKGSNKGGHGKQGEGGQSAEGKKKTRLVCRRCLLSKQRQYGEGFGGPGRGKGGTPPDEIDEPVEFEKKKIKGQMGRGKIVGEFFVKGAQVKGEVTEEFSEVVGEARQEAADALSKERIPQGYRNFVREYFNSLDAEGED